MLSNYFSFWSKGEYFIVVISFIVFIIIIIIVLIDCTDRKPQFLLDMITKQWDINSEFWTWDF